MIYSTTATSRFDNIVVSAGPSPLGSWLITTVRRLMSRSAVTQVPRDRVREAAEVRAFAESVRATDPRFANDLSAAADRHEIMGM
jgi:hypothetical protein